MMKKVLIILLLSAGPLALKAQSPFFDLGLHAGWNNTKINVKELKSSSHSGYKFGVFTRFNIKQYYIEPALDWVHKEVPVENSTATEKLKSNSLDIPVMIGTKLLRLPMFNLRVYVGPNFSYILNDMKITKVSSKELKASDTMWYLRYGAGIDLWKLTLDLNHEFGLKKFGNNIQRPNTWNVVLGIKLL